MGAHGTIARAVTFQSSTRRKFARVKPVLPYSLTLPQQYQRWLYEDYVAYWHTLTITQKNVYRDAGLRFHRTAFQHFMSVMLSNLPDIIGLWHLDYVSGGLTPDSSRNANTGTVTGASLVDGLIARSFSFDGVNDVVSVPHSASLNITGDLSISLFIRPSDPGVLKYFFGKESSTCFMLLYRDQPPGDPNRFRFEYGGSGLYSTLNSLPPLTWTHILCTATVNSVMAIYINGSLNAILTTGVGSITPNALPLDLGGWPALGHWLNCRLDHVILYNRELSLADALRHSNRRFLL